MRSIITGVLVAAMVAVASPSYAQTAGGTPVITGVLRDESGGVLPGATVTATSAATGAVAVAHTGESGSYAFMNLPAGTYAVRAEMPGFVAALRADVIVSTGETITVDFSLVLQAYGETVVVTGSRKEEMLLHVPAAVTVISAQEIELQPVQSYGDLVRRVPGINVVQFSARDVQFSARAAASQSSNKTLALLDGRSMYQPYFGMILWDLMPVDFDEIKQIEVVRGPGSAMWGSNALTGVINIITKAPREEPGTHVRIGAGELGTGDLSVRHVGVNGRVGYKVSGSVFTQDPWERPTTLPDGTPLPQYENLGTTRWQLNGRVDFEQNVDERWRFDGGYATSDGVHVTVVGPLDAKTLRQGFGRMQYERGLSRYTVSLDAHDASFIGLLSGDRTDFTYQTVTAETEHRLVLPKQVLTLAGTARFNHFDINVVPDESTRTELGIIADDEVFLTDEVRLRLGARLDWFSSFGVTASPRVGIVIEPVADQVIRASYNRSYVAPSFLENYFYFPTQTVIGLPTGPYTLPFVSQGNSDLDPLTVNAFEVGYTGSFGARATLGAAVYFNRTKGLISLVPTALYTPDDPPPGWPLPPAFLEVIPLPKELTEANLGEVNDVGFEVSADIQPAPGVALYANYSFQGEPDVSEDTPIAINIPARHRFNAGASYSRGRFFGNVSVTVTTRAFWADVQPYSGYTDGYTLVNGAVGLRLWLDGRPIVASVKVIDIGDQSIRQHIFSDVLRRRVMAELQFDF